MQMWYKIIAFSAIKKVNLAIENYARKTTYIGI